MATRNREGLQGGIAAVQRVSGSSRVLTRPVITRGCDREGVTVRVASGVNQRENLTEREVKKKAKFGDRGLFARA
eukprot:1345149-Amorphochlora_amoeboformis.AAC.3